MDHFEKEADFEKALIAALQSYGWERKVIDHPTEKELIQNWTDILFENNRGIDRLNDCPLIPEEMKSKRIVFIIDECHRSTFGEMLSTIKETFPNALFFGFTGTPVFVENEQAMSTTADIFGDELHRYSIADGIRDKNVLGFDPTMVCVYRDSDLQKKVAMQEAGAHRRKRRCRILS